MNVVQPVMLLDAVQSQYEFATHTLAAKNARIAWALPAHERSYQHDYVATRKAA